MLLGSFTLTGTQKVDVSEFIAELAVAVNVSISRFQFVSAKTQTLTTQIEIFVLPDNSLPSEELVDQIVVQSTNPASPLRTGTTGARITGTPTITELPQAKKCDDGQYIDPQVQQCSKKEKLNRLHMGDCTGNGWYLDYHYRSLLPRTYSGIHEQNVL